MCVCVCQTQQQTNTPTFKISNQTANTKLKYAQKTLSHILLIHAEKCAVVCVCVEMKTLIV